MGDLLDIKKEIPDLPHPPSKEGLPPNAIQKIAVLFTDIVGSTKYFKIHGDVAGRTMLQQHQDLASKPIIEHSGVLVKTLGDSIMAYFSDPEEAIKSAVKIQQAFSRLNETLRPEKQIHVKIGVHYGNGIVEEEDIFGNVVNLAARIIQTLTGDEIYISQDLYRRVQDQALVRFDPVDFGDKEQDLEGLSLYRVIWDRTVTFDPTASLLLYLKPLWEIGDAGFKKAWDDLLGKKHKIWNGKIEPESIISRECIALILKDATLSLDVARDLLAFFGDNIKTGNGYYLMPLHIIIDSGAFLRAGQLVLENLEMESDNLEPGSVYISSSAFRFIPDSRSFSTIPPFDADRHHGYYKLNLDNTDQNERSPLFLYQDVLVQGHNPRCFYCGDRRHPSTDCPTKNLAGPADALKQLGYHSPDTINRLYYRSLLGIPAVRKSAADTNPDLEPSDTLALSGFYDLNRIHQLRFFRTVWDAKNDDWDTMEHRDAGEEKGGMTWMAIDCIRVSNLTEAEAILKDCLAESPTDYKVHGTAAFLHIEKNDFHHAMLYLDQALHHAKKRTQRIFILFQIARLFAMQNNSAKVEKTIAGILTHHPHCPEAIFKRIILKFKGGLDGEALSELELLIDNHREFFVQALIDPELASYNKAVHPLLEKMYDHAKSEAEKALQRSKIELERLENQIGTEDEDLVKAESLLSNSSKSLLSGSYFGYLDIVGHGNMIISICLRGFEKQKTRVYRGLNDLKKRCRATIYHAADYPYKSLIKNTQKRLKWIQTEIDGSDERMRAELPGAFQEILDTIDRLSSELDGIHRNLGLLESVKKFCIFMNVLLKKGLILQLINFTLSIVLLPVIAHYLVSIFPQLKTFYQDLWSYQMGFLFYAGILGFLLAVRLAMKAISNR